MSTTGVLTTMFAKKGYGFVKPDDGGEDCFVHVKQNPELYCVKRVGVAVTFDREWNARERKCKGANCTVTGGGKLGGIAPASFTVTTQSTNEQIGLAMLVGNYVEKDAHHCRKVYQKVEKNEGLEDISVFLYF